MVWFLCSFCHVHLRTTLTIVDTPFVWSCMIFKSNVETHKICRDLRCEHELHIPLNSKVGPAKDHGKIYIEVKPPLSAIFGQSSTQNVSNLYRLAFECQKRYFDGKSTLYNVCSVHRGITLLRRAVLLSICCFCCLSLEWANDSARCHTQHGRHPGVCSF